ncbi:MAG: PD-(D/E)XK nuclease family protein [Acidobacteria bacterium]|nr:PD-(D/E)XK nuclease family protein [Acidobacteriota bacterium]
MTPNELAALLEQGALCLTATTRLARRVHAEYARLQQEAGRRQWATPQALAFEAWLDTMAARLAVAAGDATVWLNPRQETLLWRQVIESSPQAAGILNPQRAAEQAAHAWSTVAEWQLPMRDAAWDLAEDPIAFREWAREFFRRCKRAGWQSRAQLAATVAAALEQGGVEAPAVVVLAGFAQQPPRLALLLEALRKAGTRVVEHELESWMGVEASLFSFATPQAEMRAAAEWALGRLRGEARQRLAIIVPDLQAARDEWEAVLARVFPRGGGEPPPYHLSLGRPLASVGVVRAALHLTALTAERVEAETAAALLLSPYVGGAGEERIARAGRALELRERGGAVRGLELGAPSTPTMARLVMEWEARRRGLPPQQRPAEWAREFSRLFRIMGWPGRTPESEEYQAMESLRDALAELASLDAIAAEVNAHQAAELLQLIARETVFQTEEISQPLQLMSVSEATGLPFDAVWLAGFHDRAWPPPAQPVPLLPLSLQRTARMPEVTPALWLRHHRETTGELLRCAPEVTVSHARADGEEPLLASPLFPGEFRQVAETEAPAWQGAPSEQLDDAQAPEFAQEEGRGGASLLRDQAHCPFRAFALHRLRAGEFPESEIGLSAQERGVILHAAIRFCWEVLKDLVTLKETAEGRLALIIRTAVRRALTECSDGLTESFDAHVRDVEQQRLERLLALWMDVEKQREANFRVTGSERVVNVELGGLKLRTQYDRRDELDDGRLVLIDYKSNAPSPSAWDGERPDEPQVPLYAVAAKQPVAALAFAQLKRAEVKFKGVAEETGILPKVKPGEGTMAGRVTEWRRVLEKLAVEHRGGWAAVAPKSAQSCGNCHLPALCRVHEAPPRQEGEDDAGS